MGHTIRVKVTPGEVTKPHKRSKMLRNMSADSLQRLFADLIAKDKMTPAEKMLAEYVLLEN